VTRQSGSLTETWTSSYNLRGELVAIANTGGDIQERYAYSAYGVPVFLDAAFEPTSPAFDWETLYCSYRYESATGVFHVRHRVLHPELGNWVQRDPSGYAGGMALNAAYFAVNGVDSQSVFSNCLKARNRVRLPRVG